MHLCACRHAGGQSYSAALQADPNEPLTIVGTLANMHIYSKSANKSVWVGEIEQQLRFAVGAFRAIDGVVDTNQFRISIHDHDVRKVDGEFVVPFAAQMPIAWDKSISLPETLPLLFPKRGSQLGLEQFFEKYKSKCSDAGDQAATPAFFYYYFRPLLPACPLKDGDADSGVATTAAMALDLADQDLVGRHPEYSKLWEDKTLSALLIFETGGLADAAASDSGIKAFNAMCKALIAYYGKPKMSRPASDANCDVAPASRALELRFAIPDVGELDAKLILTKSLGANAGGLPKPLVAAYERRMPTIDFLAYAAQTDLDTAMRALAGLDKVPANQYQLFLISGYDTFPYVDTALRDAHARANAGQAPTKFFDLISNSLADSFGDGLRADLAVLNALVERKKSFAAILGGLAPEHALVSGAGDNRWPAAFADEPVE